MALMQTLVDILGCLEVIAKSSILNLHFDSRVLDTLHPDFLITQPLT